MASLAVLGIKETIRALRAIRHDDTPFVMAYALNKTAKEVKEAEIAEMKRVFDRPTPYALNALYLAPASKTDLNAVVGYKAFAGKGTPAEKFLNPQVEGGGRNAKSHEKALRAAGILRPTEFCVPGPGADLDAFGNMKRAQLVRLLSQVRASRDATQNMTAKSRKRAVAGAGGRYIVLRPEAGDTRSNVYGRAPAGIYLRQNGRYPIVPVLLFVKAPKYRDIFAFYAVAWRVVDQRLAFHMRAGWQKAMASRKRAA